MAVSNRLPFLAPQETQRVDVQNTSFSVDALGRFICNTWDEAIAPIFDSDLKSVAAPFDAIVIGAGMYGGYCAQKIWRRGGKVLVLEAGPFLVSEHTQNLANIGLGVPDAVLPSDPKAQSPREQVWGTPWRGNQIFPGLAFCVGGKSLYWGGWSPRLTSDVLDDFPSGARDYLNENYKWVEVQLGVARHNLDGTFNYGTGFIDDTGADGLTAILTQRIQAEAPAIESLEQPQRAPLAVQGEPPSSGLFSFDKYSSGPILVDALREDSGRSKGDDSLRRLLLVPKCHVRRLNTAGGTVNRLDLFVDNAFKSLEIPPTCKVILAMSCIESTRLALESFPTPLIGRNLMVHLRSNFVVRIPRSKFAGLKTGPIETAAVHVPGKTTANGRFHIQITGGANRNNNAEEVWFRSVPDADILRDLLKNQDSDYVALQFRCCGEMYGVKDNGTPDPNISWIDLSPERDEFLMRRAYVHLKTVPLDDALWDEMDESAFRLAEALGDGHTEFWLSDGQNGRWAKERPSAGKLNSEGNPRGPRDPLGTTYHECGTMWMGEDPFPSVTDSTGRFRHVSNAYCVDQSLFTRSGSANPVPTGLGLARQAAEIASPQPPGGFTPEPGYKSLLTFSKYEQRRPDGWEHAGSGGFQRLNDVLETEGDGIGLLVYTAEELVDFNLRVQWRSFTIRNNSGVYVRLPRKADGGFDIRTGYEIQIDNIGNRPGDASAFPEEDFNPFHQTGAIYPVHVRNVGELPRGLPNPNGKPSKKLIPTGALGTWNEYEIIVRGNRIRVLLNGQETLEGGDYVDENNTYSRGYIALQNHFKGRRVQFRHVRLKPLTANG